MTDSEGVEVLVVGNLQPSQRVLEQGGGARQLRLELSEGGKLTLSGAVALGVVRFDLRDDMGGSRQEVPWVRGGFAVYGERKPHLPRPDLTHAGHPKGLSPDPEEQRERLLLADPPVLALEVLRGKVSDELPQLGRERQLKGALLLLELRGVSDAPFAEPPANPRQSRRGKAPGVELQRDISPDQPAQRSNLARHRCPSSFTVGAPLRRRRRQHGR